jgi:general stress protein YciG
MERDPDRNPDEAPETPTDELPPPRVEDPPAPPDNKGPYTVHATPVPREPENQRRNQTVITGERKERRGFASMSPEKQREIASKGGRAAHEKGTAHEWTADEARSAGRKGGQVSRGGRGRLVTTAEPLADEGPDVTPG